MQPIFAKDIRALRDLKLLELFVAHGVSEHRDLHLFERVICFLQPGFLKIIERYLTSFLGRRRCHKRSIRIDTSLSFLADLIFRIE